MRHYFKSEPYYIEHKYDSHRIMFADSIEANVESASVHVEQGNQQLHQAKNYQVKPQIGCVTQKGP